MPTRENSLRVKNYAGLLDSSIGIDIRQYLNEPDTLFVFPSQDSADSWARTLIAAGAGKAVALGRFLGFDNFLRYCGASREEDNFQSIGQIGKWIWALEALSMNEGCASPAASPENWSLKRILPSAEPSTAHLARLVGLIPGLYELGALEKVHGGFRDLPYGFLNEEIKEMASLARHYREYLDRHHLFDGHIGPLVLPPEKKVRAYGLKDDFARLGFNNDIERQERINFPVIDTGERKPGPHTPYYAFDSFLAELERVFGNIAAELAHGLSPEDIAISVCDINAQKVAWIRQVAGEFGIPVSIRWGESLSLTTFGRLLRAIQDAAREGLTLDSLDAFCAFQSIQGRDPAGWKRLRETALRAHIPSPSPNAAYVHQIWRESWQTGLCPPECSQMYQRLLRDIEGIVRAKSFAELYGQILGFLERWVDTTQFSTNVQADSDTQTDPLSQTNLAMRMALDELQTWTEHEDRLQRHSFLPFELYMAALGTKSYIPPLKGNAVRVYDFRTASGLAVVTQYVVGASLSGLSSSLETQSALPKELSALWSSETTVDAEERLALHGIPRTEYSFAREGAEGYEVAYPLFGAPSAGNSAPPKTRRSSSVFPGLLPDAPRDETASKLGAAGVPNERQKLSPSENQVFGPDSSRTKSYAKPSPLTPIISAHFLQTSGSFDSEKNMAIFSPHSLADMHRCTFLWFAQRIGLEDDYAQDDTARVIGNFLHTTYQRAIHSLPPQISDTDAPEEFRAAFEIAIKSTLGKTLAEQGPGLRPVLTTLVEKARHRLGELYRFERETFSDYSRKGFEIPISYEFEGEGATFNGRIDCVFERADESLGGMPCYVIIDYKKNRIPSPSEMKPGARAEEYDDAEDRKDSVPQTDDGLGVGEIQVPSYALMLELSGNVVEGALYWSIEKTDAVAYLRPPATSGMRSAYMKSEDTAPVRAAIRGMLTRGADAARRGAVLELARDREVCSNCAFKPLCRYWYFLEL